MRLRPDRVPPVKHRDGRGRRRLVTVALAITTLAMSSTAAGAAPGDITELPTGPNQPSGPISITAGPDGNLWFTNSTSNQIAHMTPDGATITAFSDGLSPAGEPTAITAGPDGNLWFTELDGGRIGRILAGVVPAATAPPAVTGSATVGQVLDATGGSWSYLPTATTLQWERCPVASPSDCAPIGGATGSTFLVTTADVGTVLRVAETATNLNGPSLPSASTATAAIPREAATPAVPAPVAPVVVTPSFTG